MPARGQCGLSRDVRIESAFTAVADISAESPSVAFVAWPVFEQFTEGFDTADFKAAERLLRTLR